MKKHEFDIYVFYLSRLFVYINYILSLHHNIEVLKLRDHSRVTSV